MTELVVFAYEGRDVAFDPSAKMWNLTAMHRAAGGAPHKAPAQWLRNQSAQELIAALEEDPNYANSHNWVQTRVGNNGGTWAHWQLAAAYAHYLSPRFYLQWNQWALERYQQVVEGTPLLTLRLGALESQVATLTAQVAALTAALPKARKTGPKGKRRRSTPSQTTVQILAAIHELGGSASPSVLEKKLPKMPSSTIRVRLQRLRDQGFLRQPRIGLYELTEKAEEAYP